MSWFKQTFNSSIGRKFAMALSALFLLVFLVQHLAINFTSVFSEKTFNSLSHFMGTNPLVQFALQPVLLIGVLFHFIMGFVLEIKNKKARDVGYEKNNGAANSTWSSRNMIYSGLFILLFFCFHFADFWIPEIVHKYIEVHPEDPNRYYSEMVVLFTNPLRVAVYTLAFIFLGLHLQHGFQSAFQSMGARHNKYTPAIEKLGKVYSFLVPALYIFIAIYHYLSF
jgi:succinate dehydrogenase / fumarate reductase cytochrome b subunit